MTRKIIVFIKVNVERAYILDFRREKCMYRHLPNIYIFLQGKQKYNRIKKMMQLKNRITYKKIKTIITRKEK